MKTDRAGLIHRLAPHDFLYLVTMSGFILGDAFA
jgi:hypothetical protein